MLIAAILTAILCRAASSALENSRLLLLTPVTDGHQGSLWIKDVLTKLSVKSLNMACKVMQLQVLTQVCALEQHKMYLQVPPDWRSPCGLAIRTTWGFAL